MTPSEKALETTDSLFDIAGEHRLCDIDHCHCWDKITKVLQKYGEAEVKAKAILCKWHCGYRRFCSTCVKECEMKADSEGYRRGVEEEAINCHRHCEKARKDALEEAAKVAEFHSGPSVQCADKIRALVEGK